MEETRTAGGKEFIFSVLWTLLLLFVGKYIIFLMPQYKIVGAIITILMFCVLAFFVLTRYSAVYTYLLKDDMLRINRKIGHRNKEVEFYISDVELLCRQKPLNAPKNARTMRTSVFSKKNVWYVVYEKNRVRNMLVFEPSEKMACKIKSRVKNTKA